MTQRHLEVVRENLCPKERKEHPHNGEDAYTAIDCLKSPEYIPHVWGDLRRGDIDSHQKICFERSEWNQNPQLVNNGRVDVKIGSK